MRALILRAAFAAFLLLPTNARELALDWLEKSLRQPRISHGANRCLLGLAEPTRGVALSGSAAALNLPEAK
jgi:hypothetical protein